VFSDSSIIYTNTSVVATRCVFYWILYYLSKYQTDLPVMLGVVEVLTKLVVDFPVVDSENMHTQHDN